MQEDDRITLADIDIGHVRVEHADAPPIGDVFGGNLSMGHARSVLGPIFVKQAGPIRDVGHFGVSCWPARPKPFFSGRGNIDDQRRNDRHRDQHEMGNLQEILPDVVGEPRAAEQQHEAHRQQRAQPHIDPDDRVALRTLLALMAPGPAAGRLRAAM